MIDKRENSIYVIKYKSGPESQKTHIPSSLVLQMGWN